MSLLDDLKAELEFRREEGKDVSKLPEIISHIAELEAICSEYKYHTQRLLNKVNAVTAPYRHHGKGQVSEEDLSELCNRQIEVEKALSRPTPEMVNRVRALERIAMDALEFTKSKVTGHEMWFAERDALRIDCENVLREE